MIVKIKVTANSRKPGVLGWVDGVLKIKVAAPPIDGRANKEICETIAEMFKIAPSLVTIKSGQSSKIKTVSIESVDEKQLFAILSQQTKLPI